MPYTNPDGTAAYLIDGMNSGGMLIAKSTTAITDDIYAQKLTFSGSGGVLSDCTISAGGSIVMGTSSIISGINQTINVYTGGSMMLSSGATLRNFEIQSNGIVYGRNSVKILSGAVQSGGKISVSSSCVISAVTIKSGGSVATKTGCYISGVTTEDGAYLTYGGRVKWCGRTNDIAKGTIADRAAAYTSGGILFDYNTNGAATDFNNIIVSNLTQSSTVYASSRTIVRDVNYQASGAFMMVYSSAALYNFDASGNDTAILKLYYGAATTLSAAVTLGGTKTNIRQGGVQYLAGTYSNYTEAPDVYIENGVIHSLTMMANKEGETYWLNRLVLKEGMSAYQPVISSGASLYLYDTTAAVGAQIYDKGTLWLIGGALADSAVIKAGGALFTSSSWVHDLTIEGTAADGGYLLASQGVRMNLGGAETNFAAGTVRCGAFNGSVDAGTQVVQENMCAENGKLYGVKLVSSSTYGLRALGIYDGISAVETTISSGGALYASSGATVVNATVNSAGTIYAYDGATVSGATVKNLGTISAYAGAVISGCSLAGANISSAGLLSADADTVISGALVIDAYGALVNGRFAEGAELRLKDYAKFGGDALNVGKGQIYLNDTVAADAYVEDGVLHDLTVENFSFSVIYGLKFDNITVKAGGVINVNSKATIANTLFDGGKANLYSGCSASACTLRAGEMFMYKNTSATDLIIDGGTLQVSSSNARVYDVTVLDGALLLSSGQISGATVAGGELTAFKGAIVSGLTANGGTVEVRSGAALSGAALDAGAELNVSGGATVTGLTAGAGTDVNVLYNGTTGIGTAIFDTLENVASLSVSGIAAGNSYVLTAADAAATVIRSAKGLYENAVAKGQSYTNGVDGITYSFDGTALTATVAAIGTVAAAAKLADGATEINNGDKAAKWDATTTYSANVYLADGMTAGNAWLDIDGN